jgi:hypothetical protein
LRKLTIVIVTTTIITTPGNWVKAGPRLLWRD